MGAFVVSRIMDGHPQLPGTAADPRSQARPEQSPTQRPASRQSSRHDRQCPARPLAWCGPVGVKEIERLIRKLELDKEILAEQGENDEAAN